MVTLAFERVGQAGQSDALLADMCHYFIDPTVNVIAIPAASCSATAQRMRADAKIEH
jgi:hypothetical protein